MTATTIDTRRDTLSVACPRCEAQPGINCRTPNGHLTVHKVRVNAGQGKPAPAPAKHPRRLSMAQAERVEWAAELGRYIAPGQYATLRGEPRERGIADALERHGIIRQTGTTDSEERIFELTADGWNAYHNDPLVIRRLPDDKHPATCPVCHPNIAKGVIE